MNSYPDDLTDSQVDSLFRQASAARKLLSRCGFNQVHGDGDSSHWKRSFPNAEIRVHSMNRCELDPASVCTEGLSIYVYDDYAFDDNEVVWSDVSFGYEYLAPRLVEAVCKAMDQGETE